MKEMWDRRYSKNDLVYGKDPNLFFKSFVDSHPPGSILLPAEGEGRNALYAAAKGWNVYAIDFSSVARNKALIWATKEALSIRYDVADLSSWSSEEQFDYIGLIYGHFPEKERKKLHQKLTTFLKPGGHIFLEAFSKDQLHYESGGPKDVSMLYSIDMLKIDFSALQIDSLEKMMKEVNESNLHAGTASIIRMTAHKKN